jgi:16S rRNA (adenine1518-N6/adenine1519-N6)-dimethyltransferase
VTLRARKRLGQHFLHDPAVIKRLVAAIAPQLDDAMVEIGGGRGALTAPLVDVVSRLHVVEVDARLAEELPAAVAHPERLIVHRADALEFDFAALTSAPRTLRVVGNLPYNISTPLLFELSGIADAVLDQHFMLQKEVVDRMVAPPGSKTYGRLSVMLQFRYRMTKLFDVPRGAFAPAPKVTSSIVRMVPLPESARHDVDPAVLGRIVTEAFGQRRKTLRNSLAATLDAAAIAAAGVDPQQRAETLTLAQFVELARRATSASP